MEVGVFNFQIRGMSLNLIYTRKLGDFKVGGFAWEVKDMQLLGDFIPAIGKHGLGGHGYEEHEQEWNKYI